MTPAEFGARSPKPPEDKGPEKDKGMKKDKGK